MAAAFDVARYPTLYSFITFRPERFGALVANSLTGRELELDPAETDILSAFAGDRSLDEIIAEVQRRDRIPRFAADRRVMTLCDRLEAIQALKLHDRPQSAAAMPVYTSFRDETGTPWYSAPKNAVWDLTYLCNLKCPHCLTASGQSRPGELSTEEAFRLIENLADARVLSLSLSGGEPFLRPDLAELIRYATDQNIRTDIASNGVALDAGILAELADLPLFHVQISLDGIGPRHDEFRGKPGAFAAILDNIRLLRSQGIAVSISTTATSANYHELPALIDLAAELGCMAYKAIPFLPAGRGAANEWLKLSPEQYRTVCRTLLDKSEEYRGRLEISAETTFAFLYTETPPADGPEGPNEIMGCSAGYDTLSIGADGTAYPCPFFQTIPLGSLLEVPLTRLWRESPVLRQLRAITKEDLAEPCRNCGYAPEHCRGGCRASAWLHSGTLTGADPLCPRCAAGSETLLRFDDLPQRK